MGKEYSSSRAKEYKWVFERARRISRRESFKEREI